MLTTVTRGVLGWSILTTDTWLVNYMREVQVRDPAPLTDAQKNRSEYSVVTFRDIGIHDLVLILADYDTFVESKLKTKIENKIPETVEEVVSEVGIENLNKIFGRFR